MTSDEINKYLSDIEECLSSVTISENIDNPKSTVYYDEEKITPVPLKYHQKLLSKEDGEEEEEQNVDESDATSYEMDIRSNSPSDFNPDDHVFHLNFIHDVFYEIPTLPKKYKNGTRKSLSFSNEKMREIERHNHILLQKILTNGPSNNSKIKVKKTNVLFKDQQQHHPFGGHHSRISSGAVNRKKQQKQIDLDNEVLKRKLETIGRRRKSFYQ